MLAESTLFLQEETAALSDCIRQIEADQELQERLRQQKIRKTEQYNDLRRLAASRHVILEQMTSEIQSRFGANVPPPVRNMFKILLGQQIKIVKARDELAAELEIASPASTPVHSQADLHDQNDRNGGNGGTGSDAETLHHNSNPNLSRETLPSHIEQDIHSANINARNQDAAHPESDLSFNYDPGSFLNVVQEEAEEQEGAIAAAGAEDDGDLESDRPPSMLSFGSN